MTSSPSVGNGAEEGSPSVVHRREGEFGGKFEEDFMIAEIGREEGFIPFC